MFKYIIHQLSYIFHVLVHGFSMYWYVLIHDTYMKIHVNKKCLHDSKRCRKLAIIGFEKKVCVNNVFAITLSVVELSFQNEKTRTMHIACNRFIHEL